MTNDRFIGIKEASKLLNVSPKTLRLWTTKKLIEAFRVSTRGHRKYKLSDVHKMMNITVTEHASTELPIAVYARVSSHEQKVKGDLDRQKSRLLEHCVTNKYVVGYVFDEVGSGMNDKRSKLLKLMDLAAEKKISKILIEHKDRLIRFNYNILIKYFTSHGVTVEFVDIILNKSFENELVEDMLTLMASFSAKIYGKRSHKNKDINEKIEKAKK